MLKAISTGDWATVGMCALSLVPGLKQLKGLKAVGRLGKAGIGANRAAGKAFEKAVIEKLGLKGAGTRLAKVKDLDLQRGEICVSSPKGLNRWTDGTEVAPIMPGCEHILSGYLTRRAEILGRMGLHHEALFPFVSKQGRVGYWSRPMWSKLKRQVELASGTRFRWKDFRPTLAQSCKDAGAPIEAISKVLRHTSSNTTERYYARIRSESAFSLVKDAWQARKPLQAQSVQIDT
ncbi:MAG: site-specific integrase [Thermoplasmata archaeon]